MNGCEERAMDRMDRRKNGNNSLGIFINTKGVSMF